MAGSNSRDAGTREKAIAFDNMMESLVSLVVSRLERDYILTPKNKIDYLNILVKFCCEKNGVNYHEFQSSKQSTERDFISVKESVCYMSHSVLPAEVKDAEIGKALGFGRINVIHHRKKMVGICSVDELEALKYLQWIKEYKSINKQDNDKEN